MQKSFLSIGVVFALLAVIFGAFGAHALKTRLTPDSLQVFETAVKYQFYHALALMLTVLLTERVGINWTNLAGYCFIAGVCLFSGSLYLLSCKDVLGIQNWRWLGPITPLGGLSFIMGWISLFVGALKSN